jgi:hypothetical protein
MPADAKRALRTLWGGLVRLANERRSGVAPTDHANRSWPQAVNSCQEIPHIYKPFFDALPAKERDPFPYSALTPIFRGVYRKPENQRLVCNVARTIHIVEKTADKLAATCYAIEEICYVENGTILLYPWITIYGAETGGNRGSVTLRFNSVTDHIMAPFLECMRRLRTRARGAATTADQADFTV